MEVLVPSYRDAKAVRSGLYAARDRARKRAENNLSAFESFSFSIIPTEEGTAKVIIDPFPSAQPADLDLILSPLSPATPKPKIGGSRKKE